MLLDRKAAPDARTGAVQSILRPVLRYCLFVVNRIALFLKRELRKGAAAAKDRESVRDQILLRFEWWLDDVLAEEKAIEGISAELLSELSEEKRYVENNRTDGSIYSTWSAMTALTQEVKLQGRAFKDLGRRLDPLLELGKSVDSVIGAHKEAISTARRIAEEAFRVQSDRERQLVQDAENRVRRELMDTFIDLRQRLITGLTPAQDGLKRLYAQRKSSWLNRKFFSRSSRAGHMIEIVSALEEGYRLGLERIDETMRHIGIDEIVCSGKPFDPRMMKVVDVEETAEVPDGTVLEVYWAGYMMNNEVLHPARVKVARAPTANAQHV